MKISNKISIRKAKVIDLSKIFKLSNSLLDYHQRLDRFFEPKRKTNIKRLKLLKKHIYSQNKLLLVCENNKKIIGFIATGLFPAPPWMEEKCIGRINQTFIERKYRHLGIGKKLLDTTLRWLKKKKVHHAEVSFSIKNDIGKSAWHKYGFKDLTVVAIKKLK